LSLIVDEMQGDQGIGFGESESSIRSAREATRRVNGSAIFRLSSSKCSYLANRNRIRSVRIWFFGKGWWACHPGWGDGDII